MADDHPPRRRRRRGRRRPAIRCLAGAAAVAALAAAAAAPPTAAATDRSPAERAGGRLVDGAAHVETAVWDAAAAAGPSGVLSPDAAAWAAAYAADVADAAAADAATAFAAAHPWLTAAARRLPVAVRGWAPPLPARAADAGAAAAAVASTTRQTLAFGRLVRGTASAFALDLDDRMPAAEVEAVVAAARLWAAEWPSRVPVRVEVTWADGARFSLGSAETPTFHPGGIDGTRVDTAYGAPLYLSLTGLDVVPSGSAHIVMSLNRRIRWHTDLGRRAPGDRWDLTTVAAHELGHGLFFTGRISGFPPSATATVPLSSSVPETSRFDTFIADLDGNAVVASCMRGRRPRLAGGLYNAVTASGLAFRTNGSAADGGVPPTRLPLFAPKPYDPGSSVYHFDGDLLRDGCDASGIPADECSSLMEAALPSGKTARSLGANTLRVMRVVRSQGVVGVEGGTCAVSSSAPGSVGGRGAGDLADRFGGGSALTSRAGPSLRSRGRRARRCCCLSAPFSSTSGCRRRRRGGGGARRAAAGGRGGGGRGGGGGGGGGRGAAAAGVSGAGRAAAAGAAGAAAGRRGVAAGARVLARPAAGGGGAPPVPPGNRRGGGGGAPRSAPTRCEGGWPRHDGRGGALPTRAGGAD
ncbi:hypothetical protein BU14_0381s0021 [Porphyra umbilicalis]|uniref:Peptidase M10 metallopeptidase domain-containing protein n=1 Tax=Porphyra umbilicalis TaxID=2786 RepID=A0A1X6NX36_PORUM|nr:hypothetical protein BU14_0381s0021 [Porphyra umbilicalis]|eukprot:OSX73080.1 hypothetical protein BU14_0381s0021 [Porphyra umbilicalis]